MPDDDDPFAKYTQNETESVAELIVFNCKAIPVPPGTKAPPRPNGRVVRVALPVSEPAAAVVADLLERVQLAINGLNTDPTNLDSLRKAAAALPRAS